jgi:hypothetical protein
MADVTKVIAAYLPRLAAAVAAARTGPTSLQAQVQHALQLI